MNNGVLGQVLGGLFANAMRGRASGGGLGGGMAGGMGGLGAGGLGAILGGMMGGRRTGGRGGLGAGGGALIGLLLPLAMQWVQRNGGIGAVLGRMQQKGYSDQASSWVSTGPNHALDPQAIDDLVGSEELSRISQQLDMPREEVAQGFAEILPEMVDQLTPTGEVSPEADDVLGGGLSELETLMRDLKLR